MIKQLLTKAILAIVLIFSASVTFAQSTFVIQVGPGFSNTYSPANVTCAVGDTISFVWVSGFHPTQSLDLTTIPVKDMDGSGGSNSVYKIKMLTAGTFPYECTAHSGMGGIITVTAPVSNTPVLTENFNYTLNDTLSQIVGSGWTPIATVSNVNKIPVTAGITYAGSTTNSIGNAALIKNTGQDAGKAFTGTNIRSGNVYSSFLINVSAAQAAGDYFFALFDSALNGTNYRARTFIKSSGTGYRIGISKSGAVAAAGFNTTDLVFGTTYQIVVKYSIISGATNDSVKLFVNPVLGSSEPTPTASALVTENDITISSTVGLGAVALRQGSSTNAPTLSIDGIIVGRTWASVTPLQTPASLKFNPTTLSVNENAGTATVTLNVTNPNAAATSVDVLVKGGTATAGSDYTFTSQTVTFPANSSTAQTFTIPIVDDASQEADETIILALRNTTNSATIEADSVLTITIPANDVPPPTVKFSTPLSATVAEGGSHTFNIEIANANSSATGVKLFVKSISTASGTDYTGITSGATFTFPANSTTNLSGTINIVDDILAEQAESIVLVLRDPTNLATIGADSVFSITIPINDQPVSTTPVLVENFNYNLNDTLSQIVGAGWTPIATVSNVNKMPVVSGLTYLGSSGSGVGNAAFINTTGQDAGKVFTGTNIRSGNVYASFLMNVTSAQSAGDYFFALLDSALSGTNYRARTFIKSSGTGYRIGISKSGAVGVAGFNTTDLSFGTTYQVVIKYSIISGTANDSVKLFIDPVLGSSEPAPTAVAVTTENDITISNTVGLGAVALRQGTGSNAPTLKIDGIIVGQTWGTVTPYVAPNPSLKFNPTTLTVNENAGTATVTLNVTNPNASATTVDVKVKGGTATAGTDYTFTTQTVTFPASSTSAQSFTFPIIDDTAQETDETIILALRNTTNSASIEADSILTITIPANDIVNPVVSFATPLTATVAEGADHIFNVAITNPNATATDVKVFVKSVSTASGSDYSGVSTSGTTLTFASNSSANVSDTANIINDLIAENAETIVLVLRDATNNATIGNDSIITITIPTNDQPLVAHFTAATVNANENAGTATVNVMAMGATTNGSTSFDVVVKGGTAVSGSDYTYSTQTITIPAGKDSTVAVNIALLNDNVFELNENITLAIRNITNSGVIGTDSVITVNIINDDIQFKNVSALKVNDVNGVSVLKDTSVYIRGIVYGVDMQGSATSLQYTLIDPTGGVGIFRSGSTTPPIISLVPEEGDSVKVYGKVGEFNGLTQVNMDSIVLISKGNALKAPRVVTQLDESTESDLVIFKNAEIIDTLANSASGTTLRISNGTDSLDLRIDADVNLFAQPIVGKFDVVGLGGQFDNSNPKNSGYQLLPRSINDVIPVITVVPVVSIDSAIYNTKEGNGTKTVNVHLSAATTEVTSVTFALTGGSAIFNSDFTFGNPGTLTFAPGDTVESVTFTITDDATIENNETINFSISDPSKCTLGTITSASIVIRDNDFQGVVNNNAIVFNVYPNPASDIITIVANENIQTISVVNMIGQTVLNVNANSLKQTINISELSAGVYNIIVNSENGYSTKRLIVK